jgi:poly-beta-1,6-N-acetyl-D-glucosamine synthase
MICRYALMTAARNEAAHIGETIRTVVAQTIKPMRWVIVSDGSTDATDEIVADYAMRHEWIRLVRREREPNVVGFVSKVRALRLAVNELRDADHDFIGNLDADITLEPSYYETVCSRFNEDPSLGLAGGFVYDLQNGEYRKHSPDVSNYVSGSIQLFRRQCFDDVGGYVPLEAGGEDTVAVVMAQMKGWKVRMFPELRAVHHGLSAAKRGALAEFFREGVLFSVIGSHPLFEVAKTVGRVARRPYFVGALARLAGLLWTWCYERKRAVPDDVVRYLRAEQMKRMRSLIYGHR